MDIRDATRKDVDQIRTVARASLDASYGHVLADDVIDSAVERWYAEADLADDLTDDRAVFLVAVDRGEVVGFAQGYVVGTREPTGEIDWLHVHPDARGEGVGTQLLRAIESELVDRDVHVIEGRVLVDNEAGATFYTDHGFEADGDREMRIGDEQFVERAYVKHPENAEARTVLEERAGPSGETLFVAFDEAERAQKGPFYAVYTDAEREQRYGWFCGNCESLDTSMDSMGRIECGECGNRRKAARWDAAYL